MFKLRKFSDLDKLNESVDDKRADQTIIKWSINGEDQKLTDGSTSQISILKYLYSKYGDRIFQADKTSNTMIICKAEELEIDGGKYSFYGRNMRIIKPTTKFLDKNFKETNPSSDDLFIVVDTNLSTQRKIEFLSRLMKSLGCSDIETDIVMKQKVEKAPRPQRARNNVDRFSDNGDEEFPESEGKVNPFQQAICVVGDSGAGKSVTIEKILKNEGHQYEFIIPTESTTGLLSQFSPRGSRYVRSILSEMIIEASCNPKVLYTAVFDEMHKSKTIEMINDELLQSISTKRNDGVRFISLDPDTIKIFEDDDGDLEPGLEKIGRRLIIPKNLGFIFISSKPKVIYNNTDFFNRVDIIKLEQKDRSIKTSNELLSKVLDDTEKQNIVPSKYD